MTGGSHIVPYRKDGFVVGWYVYAWRGGPKVLQTTGAAKPKLTAELLDRIAKARQERKGKGNLKETIGSLIVSFTASPEFQKLSKTTKPTMHTWFRRIDDEFGKAPVAVFNDRKIRSDINKWRNRWADKPRSADVAIEVLCRLLSYATDLGMLDHNHAKGIKRLYTVNRSELIWEQEHFDRFAKHAPPYALEAVTLAAWTGLRLGDLVSLRWDAVNLDQGVIVWDTSKSRQRTRATIPILPEVTDVLGAIRRRYAQEMAARRPKRRKPLPETVLASSRWTPWTASGLGDAIAKVCSEVGIDRHVHDLRGTFVTYCAMRGLTDDQIADIVGWETDSVSRIRRRYVAQDRVAAAIAARLNGGDL